MSPPRWRHVVTPALLAAAGLAASISTMQLQPITDEGALVTGAARILQGGVFFRDVDAYPLPGAWYLLAAVMRVFGQSLVVSRGLEAVVFTAAVVLAYLIGRRIMGGFAAGLLGISLVAVKYWAWPLWNIYFYADVATALALGGMLAFLAVLRGGSRGAAFAAGGLLGLATCCKQTVGLYPGIAASGWLLVSAVAAGRKPGWLATVTGADSSRRPWRALGWYLGGVVAAVGIPFAAFAAVGLGREFFVNGFWRPLTGYLPQSGVPYTTMLRWWELGHLSGGDTFAYFPPLAWMVVFLYASSTGHVLQQAALAAEAASRLCYLAAPVAFLACGWLLAGRLRRGEWTPRDTAALAASALGGAAFLSVFPRADFPHLTDLAPVWLICFFLAGDLLAQRVRPVIGRRLIQAGMAGVAAAGLAGGLAMVAGVYHVCPDRIDVPRAGHLRCAPGDDQMKTIITYVRSHTKPGEPIFVYGHEAYYYFLCDRYSPWRFPQLYPGMTGEGAGGEVARLIERHRIRYVISGVVSMPTLPPVEAYAPALTRYIAQHYRPVKLTNRGHYHPDELLERADERLVAMPAVGRP